MKQSIINKSYKHYNIMRKTIFLLVALVATITNLVAQEEIDHANNALVWDTRTYWTHNSGRTF
ncbi:MAG: hypothetical protein LBL47_00380, partial [Lactobacillus sp.]|nr:hypothetical protein [Lactobacillus sp.]